ncbi:MAG: CBS domain-containing protein [Deltaproteobacteria bacterium]|nr:CBS domain-containing protein [Deltaproteobacteria bacterium]
MFVGDRMSRRVVTAPPQLPLAEARALLERHHIRQLPVLQGTQLVGIITDRDLRAAPATTRAVRQAMTANPLTIAPDAPVDEAARLLRAHKINALPVIKAGKLSGILTASDVLGAFIELSGVAERTYRIIFRATAGTEGRVRRVIEGARGEIKWLHREHGRARRLHVRLKARRIEDVTAALEGAGFEVSAVVAPPPRRG